MRRGGISHPLCAVKMLQTAGSLPAMSGEGNMTDREQSSGFQGLRMTGGVDDKGA